jgi:hypothetical protein
MIMQENIDRWLRTKSKNENNYLRNLEIISAIRHIDTKVKYNSKEDVVALTGFVFDPEGNIKPIATPESVAPRSPKRSSRGIEDGQYMKDLISNFK